MTQRVININQIKDDQQFVEEDDWLICVSVNANDKSRELNFSSDPTGGDGVI